MLSLLDRHRFCQSHLSANQREMDFLNQNFSKEATNVSSLLGMTAASFAFKASRLAFLTGATSSLGKFLPKFVMNTAASALGLVAEVSTLRASNKLAAKLSGEGIAEDIFERQGFLGTAVDILALKCVGHAFAHQNFILREFASSNAMVFGHAASAHMGWTREEGGDYLSKMAHAVVTNFQLNAGMACMGLLSGGRISSMERSLDFEIQNISSSLDFKNAQLAHMFSDPAVAQRDMSRAEQILDRNNGFLHDLANLLSSPLGNVSIIVRTARLSLAEDHPFRVQVQNLLDQLNTAIAVINEIRAQRAEMITVAESLEDKSDFAQRDTDRVRLKISEFLEKIHPIKESYRSIGHAYAERPALMGYKNYQKLEGVFEKLEGFAAAKLKELEETSLPALVSLNTVLREAWNFSEAERVVADVETEEPDLLPTDFLLHIDSYSLMSAIQNLLVNACHAMRGRPLRQLRLHGHLMEIEGKNQIVIEVRDTGSGIPDALKGDIFRAGFSTKEKMNSKSPSTDTTAPVGTGMGLYMVSEIVKKYGGELTLESTVGEGSTFRIRLNPFDPSLGIDEKISAEASAATDEGSRGRKYSQKALKDEESNWKKIFGEVVRLDSEESLKDSATRGKTLAEVARTILQNTPYPDCQRALFKVHRMLELAYVRFDFDMLRSYRENVDPEVGRYMDFLIQQANVRAPDKDHFYTHDEMSLELPGIYVVPQADHLRTNISTQFAGTSRSVSETASVFAPESVPAMVRAFVNTFKNSINSLQTAVRMLDLVAPGMSVQKALSEDFAEARTQRIQNTLNKALSDAAEYRRILLTNKGEYSRHFFALAFNDPAYNLRAEYNLLTSILNQIPEEQRQEFGIQMVPSDVEIMINLFQ